MLRRRPLLVVLSSLVFGATGAAWCGSAEKERAEPPPQAQPVTINGVRYEAPHWTRSLDLPSNGGWVIAYEASSGERLWAVQVVPLAGTPGMEQDKREVFIVGLRPEADRLHLRVLDERGGQWRLDLHTRGVISLRRKHSGS